MTKASRPIPARDPATSSSATERELRQEALKWQRLYAEAVQHQASASAEVAPLQQVVARLTAELSAACAENEQLSVTLALQRIDSESREHALRRELRAAEERATQAWQCQLERSAAAQQLSQMQSEPLRQIDEANRRADAAEDAETRCAAALLSNSEAVANAAQLVRQAMATAAAAEADGDEQRRAAAEAESRAEDLQARLDQLLGGEREAAAASPPQQPQPSPEQPHPSPLQPQPSPLQPQRDEGGCQTEAAQLRMSRQETRRLQLLLEESLSERLALTAKLAHLDPVAARDLAGPVTPLANATSRTGTPRTSCETSAASVVRSQKTPRRDAAVDRFPIKEDPSVAQRREDPAGAGAEAEAEARQMRARLFSSPHFRGGGVFQMCLMEARHRQANGIELDELDRTVLGPPTQAGGRLVLARTAILT